ncbi:hypothetical protein FO519_000113 [Halicephalobus sp. NKZ332]|nr:hypothetical protein FO519_000113 [Halicephalobus sp. NKZ332]
MMSMDQFDPFGSFSSLNAAAVAEKISGRLALSQPFIPGQLPGVNKRVYYCQRCLNHGRLEPRKNHKCECIFANCTCNKCILVEKRRVLNTQLHELEETDSGDTAESPAAGVPEAFQNRGIENYEIPNFGRIKGERVPNCQKCGQHGRKSRLKGHKRVCPFKDCNCPKCQVVTERQKLMADQIKIRRRQRKDTLMNLTREKITATLNAAAAVAAAGPLPYLNNLSMIYNQLSQSSTLPPVSSIPSTASPGIQTTVSPSLTTSPTLSKPSAFLPVQSSATQLSYGPSSADLIKAAAAISGNSEPSLQLSQFPLFLGGNPSAALAAITGNKTESVGVPVLPVSSSTSEPKQETHIKEDVDSSVHSPSPSGSSPPSIDNNLAAPIPINPLAGLQTSLLPPNNLPTQEQLLAFLANVQLSNCFPGINFNSMDSGETKSEENSSSGNNGNNTFVDVCSV